MYGQNPKRPPIKNHDGLSLDVVDIFPTIQGEGPFAGQPAIFLRLGGCNLACDFCDTEFESYQAMTLEAVVSKAIALSPYYVVENESYPSIAAASVTPTPLAGGAGGGQSDTLSNGYGKESHSTRKAKAQAQAQHLRDNPTDAERKLWNQALAKSNLGIKFRRQQTIGDYIVDFVCMSHKIIVELDGGGHNSDIKREEDKQRTAFLEQGGYRVLRFWNNEVMDNLEGVVQMILHYVDDSHRRDSPPLAPPTSGVGKVKGALAESRDKACQDKPLIVITGGEPMRHHLAPLCEALLEQGFRIQIETNGTLYQALPKQVHIVCSPKNTGGGYAPIRPDLLVRVDALKFIISHSHVDYTDVPEWCRAPNMPPIYVQPMDEYDVEKNRANQLRAMELAMQHGYRLSIQLHKILGIQ